MTPNKMKRRIASQEKAIARLREQLRIERGINLALSKLQYAPQQKRSHLVSLKKYAAKKGVAA